MDIQEKIFKYSIVAFIMLFIVCAMFLCCETLQEKNTAQMKSNLSQKQQIINMLNFRIKYCFDEEEKRILKDVVFRIKVRIPD